MEATTRSESEATATAATSKLFQGYQLQIGEGESALSWQLSSGLTWRKKIWPRLSYPQSLHRWNTVEEILSYLISFESHKQWITTEVPVKPPSGTILFFNRTKTKNYRSDGYDWKTRKSNASIREDRMKLKVCGMQLLYGCYTHCASIPNLHRRSYWLIQDPDIIMVHYLEVEGDTMTTESLTPNVDFALQDEAELRRSLTPTNWAYLTISDKNLCSILIQCNTALEIHTLAAQLRLTLDHNLTKATTLDHAVATNNSGLPFDWVKEAQPRRTRARVAPKETSGSCLEASSTGNAKLINIGGVAPNVAAVSEQANENQILKALSSSPHIILCCPQNGSVSYVLLNSASLAGGLGKAAPGVGREGETGEVNRSTAGPSGLENKDLGGSSKPESLPAQTSSKGNRGSKGKCKADPPAPQNDYDLSNFSNFASRLTEVDPLQGLIGLEPGGLPENYKALLRIPGGQNLETPMNTGPTSQNTHGTFAVSPTTTTLSPVAVPNSSCSFPNHTATATTTATSTNSHGFDGNSQQQGHMFDLSLNLDPESLRDLLKVPLSPEVMAGGERETEVRREEAASVMEGTAATLSPISQLMQSLVPPVVGGGGEREGEEREEEVGFREGSLPCGVRQLENSSEMESQAGSTGLQDAENYIDIHSAMEGLHHSVPASTSLSSLSVFPEHRSPLPSSYQWEELLHRPSDSLGQSEATPTHSSHTVSSHSATQPQFHSTTSHSGATLSLHSVPSPTYPHHHHSPLSLPTSLPFLREIQASVNVSQSRMESLYPTVSGPLPPISLPNPLDEPNPCVFSGEMTLRPLPGGSPSFLSSSPSSHHSPALRPPSPPSLSDTSHPGMSSGAGAMETCLLPGQHSLSRSVSPRSLSNIPEDVPMSVLLDPLNQHLVQQGAVGNFMDPSAGLSLPPSSSYRVMKSSTPSSPSIGSVSGHSTVSSLFDPGGESPSVLELCELLSESPNVQQHDFSNTTFTDIEQKQLYRAIQIIQNTFRKFKTQWQQLPRVEDRQKHAALLIENYYTRYRQLKQQQDRAARRIQHNYRMYRNRSREMNRAALFIQQMYRFHRIKRQQPETYTTTIRSPPFQHMTTIPITTIQN